MTHHPGKAHVRQLFSRIAPTYDRVNTAVSMGFHHLWNQTLVNALHAGSHHNYLDLCAGTGAIASRYMHTYRPDGEVTLVDFCPDMLHLAEERLQKHSSPCQVQYMQADATAIPLTDQKFDRISLAYGLRNIEEPRKAISECYRLLRSGGCVGILELTRPKHPLLRKCHHLWINQVVTRVGGWMSQDKQAYHYLNHSIENFVEPSQVELLLQEAGFHSIIHRPIMGQIASLFLAYK